MGYKTILYDVEDNIARVTLNIPEKLNRLSIETMKEVGPDGDICEPDLCGPDRPCCVPVERPKLE